MRIKIVPVVRTLVAVCAGSVVCASMPAVAALPAANGTSPSTAVAQLVMDAQKAIKAGKLPLAIIILKNATSADPHNGQVRAQLGAVLLRTGDYYDAERELRQARRDGAPDQLVLPTLFSTMIARNEQKNLLDEFPEPLSNSNVTPDILHARALAYFDLGQLADATAAIDKALKLRRSVPGLLLRARIAQKSGDQRASLQFANDAIAFAPDNIDAPLFKVALLLETNDTNAALALADQLVTKYPASIPAMVGRIEVLLRMKKDDQAKAAVDAALAKTPGMPIGVYYRALLIARAGNEKEAWRIAQGLPQEFLQIQPGIALSVSQMADRSGNVETAAAILNGAISRFSQNAELRRRLAGIRVRQNDVDGAITVLEPLKDKMDPATAQTLAALYVRSKRASQAQGMLEKLIQSGNGTDATVLQLVALETQLGQPDQALKDLTAAVNQKPTSVMLASQLVGALIARQRYADASAVADKVGSDPAQRLTSLLLQGQVLLAEHKFDDALASFAKAMQIDSANQIALYGHATSLESLQRFADSEKDLRAILALNPQSMAAYLKLAELAARKNEDGQVRGILAQAIKASPQDPAPRLALARYLASRNDRPDALNAVNGLLKSRPESTDGVALLGSIQLSMGKKADAIATFRRLVGLAPRVPGFQILLGNALFANGDKVGANAALKSAVNLAQNSAQVRVAQINMLFSQKDSAGAVTAAQAYGVSNPGVEADLLLADTLVRAGRRDQAMTLYRKSLVAHPNSSIVLRIAANSIGEGDRKSAVETLSNWVSANPDDTAVRAAYATLLMQQENNSGAVREFREILKRSPNDIPSLNNLAWLRRDQDPKEALALANRAAGLAPNSSDVLDTLGWIKLKHGKAADSLPLFQRAHELRPRDGEISYHLVLSLDATGSHAAAAGLLKALLASKVGFSDLAEANKLAQSWH